jgi:hypothetical protein
MRLDTRKIIQALSESFVLPQEISVAEAMTSRFVAGERPVDIAHDYKDHVLEDVHDAIRFFILYARGNRSVRAFYDENQAKRFTKEV